MLIDLIKPRVKKDKFSKIKERVKELSEALEKLETNNSDAGKAMYYLAELKEVGSQWADIVEWPNPSTVNFVRDNFQSHKEGKFSEKSNIRTAVNCPRCGLTPLTSPPVEYTAKLSDYFCYTCDRFVIFNKAFYTGTRRVRVEDEYILVL
jgi:hypothetical protein